MRYLIVEMVIFAKKHIRLYLWTDRNAMDKIHYPHPFLFVYIAYRAWYNFWAKDFLNLMLATQLPYSTKDALILKFLVILETK